MEIDETLEERKIVVDALTDSYKHLLHFAREHVLGGSMSKRDMTILGRKLFTAFEHKAGKVSLVNHGISKGLSETHLYLEHIEPSEGQSYWLLYRESVGAGQRTRGAVVRRAWTCWR